MNKCVVENLFEKEAILCYDSRQKGESDMDILENWYEQIKGFEKLSLKEAKQLIEQARNESQKEKQEELYERVILGTLYVVYDVLKDNRYSLLQSGAYDMNDIISAANELFIRGIKSGEILNLKVFSRFFNHGFFTELENQMIEQSERVIRKMEGYGNNFAKYYKAYIALRENRDDITLEEFLKVISSKDIGIYYFSLFETLYEKGVYDETLSELKISQMRHLILEKSLVESIEEKTLIDETMIDQVIEKVDVMNFLRDTPLLTDRQKYYVMLKFGLMGDLPQSYRYMERVVDKKRSMIHLEVKESLKQMRYELKNTYQP